MALPMTARQEAEAIWQIGEDITGALKALDLMAPRFSAYALDRWNAIANIDQIDTIAKDIGALGEALCRECDHAEEAADRRRDNPLEPDHRRLGQ